MLRDRLLAHLAAQGQAADYQRTALEVLGIRGAPPALARTLVEQAMVIEDRRAHWQSVGKRVVRDAPASPGVYVFRDWAGCVLYVGKASNLRRRLSAHFAERRWLTLPADMARVETVDWRPVGSEIEALLCEARFIRELQPLVNVQTAAPALHTRAIPASLVRNVVLLLPSIDPDAIEILAVRTEGATLLQRVPRRGTNLARHSKAIWTFLRQRQNAAGDGSAPLVYSWLAGRGHRTTRVNLDDVGSATEFRERLSHLLTSRDLFVDRLIAVWRGTRRV